MVVLVVVLGMPHVKELPLEVAEEEVQEEEDLVAVAPLGVAVVAEAVGNLHVFPSSFNLFPFTFRSAYVLVETSLVSIFYHSNGVQQHV